MLEGVQDLLVGDPVTSRAREDHGIHRMSTYIDVAVACKHVRLDRKTQDRRQSPVRA
jgi:hypothetical protein